MNATTPIRTTSEEILRFFFSEPPASTDSPAILLDRDGVINERIVGGYVTQWSEFRFIKGIAAQIAALSKLGLPILVTSNQAGVGKGLIPVEVLAVITERFVAQLHQHGAQIDAVYHCPHAPDARCGCRKPATGLLTEAARNWQIGLKRSVLVGDSTSDVEAARASGCRCVLWAHDDANDSGAMSSAGAVPLIKNVDVPSEVVRHVLQDGNER